MIKQAKAGKPIDVDAVPPPVATGAAQPSAPVQAAAVPEDMDTSNEPTKLEQTTQDGMSKPLQGHGECIEK